MELLRGVGDGHADGGPAGHRLHHAGHRGGAGEAVNVPVRVVGPLPLGGLHPQGSHQALGQVLVHGQGGAHIPRPGVGDAHEVKGSLHPAILPAGPVEGQEHQVCLTAEFQHAGAKLAGALPRPGGFHRLQIRGLGVHLLPPVRDGLVNAGLQGAGWVLPAEVEGYQGRPVAQPFQGVGDHGARGQGHVPLRAQAPGQDYNFHGRLLSQKPAESLLRRGYRINFRISCRL